MSLKTSTISKGHHPRRGRGAGSREQGRGKGERSSERGAREKKFPPAKSTPPPCLLPPAPRPLPKSLFFGAVGTMIVDITFYPSLTGFSVFGLFCLGAIVIARHRRELDKPLSNKTKIFSRYKITTPIFVLVGSFYLIDGLSTPAHAQFFQNAETWMSSTFQGAGEAIPLVFNVLRGLFLIYLGISLVKVIQAVRQDEDWQNLARTPMMILIAVTMADILTNLIIGGAGGGAGGAGGG